MLRILIKIVARFYNYSYWLMMMIHIQGKPKHTEEKVSRESQLIWIMQFEVSSMVHVRGIINNKIHGTVWILQILVYLN